MKSAVRDLVDRMFSGSVESLMMNLLKTENVDEATVERLRKVISRKGQA
jgi:predicted transcriptional regulator